MNYPSTGDTDMLPETEARNQLILSELSQVYYVARRIHERLPQHVPFEDLVHAGVMGLIDAVRKYNPKKNASLKSFASFRIRGAIFDSLRAQDWGSRPCAEGPQRSRKHYQAFQQTRPPAHRRRNRSRPRDGSFRIAKSSAASSTVFI